MLVFPYLYALDISLMKNGEAFIKNPVHIPWPLHFENYIKAFKQLEVNNNNYFQMLFNSLWYSALTPALKALTECGKYAQSKGITIAIETGPETAATLLSFVENTEGGVGVNLDPANFVMVTGQDPVEAVYLLKDHIVHTHFKDGKMIKKTDPKIIYDSFAVGGIEALNTADYFIETPIGEGDVDFIRYFKALKDIGYKGFLTI